MECCSNRAVALAASRKVVLQIKRDHACLISAYVDLCSFCEHLYLAHGASVMLKRTPIIKQPCIVAAGACTATDSHTQTTAVGQSSVRAGMWKGMKSASEPWLARHTPWSHPQRITSKVPASVLPQEVLHPQVLRSVPEPLEASTPAQLPPSPPPSPYPGCHPAADH